MCLIIVKPANKEIPEGLLRTAYDRNRDGWGLMRIGRQGPFIRKGVSKFSSFLDNYRQYRDYECAIHFRACSCGVINGENCHPFKVNNDTYLMHNGHFGNIPITDKKMSDTWHFAKMLSRYSNDEIFSKQFIEKLERLTENQKLVLLNKDHGFVVLNKHEWLEDPETGALFSNMYSFDASKEFLIHNWGEEATSKYLAWRAREEKELKKEERLENEARSKQGVPYQTRQEYIEFWTELLDNLDAEKIQKNLSEDLRAADRLSGEDFYGVGYDKESDLANQDSLFYPVAEHTIEEIASNIEILNMAKDEVRELALHEPDVMALAIYRTLQRL